MPTELPPIDPAPSVVIPLRGKHGEGHSMKLDAADWEHARRAWGEAWGRNGPGGAVVSLRVSGLRLARLLLGAWQHERIGHRDGDRLNLTRANLVLVPRMGREDRPPAPIPEESARTPLEKRTNDLLRLLPHAPSAADRKRLERLARLTLE